MPDEVIDVNGYLWVPSTKPSWPWVMHDRETYVKSVDAIEHFWGPIVEWSS
jgi:hypothetical protein